MQSKKTLARMAAGALALSLIASACSKDDKTESTAKSDYKLTGMKGTTPLTDLDKIGDFKAKLDKANGGPLEDYNYGAESYDIVNVLALAAEQAKSDAPGAVAAQIVKVTRDGEKCKDFKSCKAILDKKGDIDYDGVSGPTDMAPNGDPSEGSYGVLKFDDKNELQTEKFVVAEAAADAGEGQPQPDPAFGPKADGVLKLGTILPKTGSLAFLGPPEFAGVKLGVEEVNAAGGVLGKPVEVVDGDSVDKANQAYEATVNKAIAAGVDALIGAASSGVTESFLQRAVAQGMIVFSPANTAKSLSVAKDKGLYYRLAPSDILQGQVLADLVAEDGHTEVAVLALQDPYGEGLADDFTKAFEASGGKVLDGFPIIYKADATSFDSEVQKVVDAKPDAFVLIGFEESAKILKGLINKGMGPDKLATYGVDGNMGNALVTSLNGEG